MLLSRETDYALRILQNLMDGQRRSVGEISNAELIPQQFAYKIIRKLAKAGLIEITRGNAVDDATLIFGGHYEDAKGSFDYYFVLRPWGMRWDNVAYTLPKSYYNWYLPLLEAGAAHCPDTIGN